MDRDGLLAQLNKSFILVSWSPGVIRPGADLAWGQGQDLPIPPIPWEDLHVLHPRQLVLPAWPYLSYLWGGGYTDRQSSLREGCASACYKAIAFLSLPYPSCPWHWLLLQKTEKGALGCSQGDFANVRIPAQS